MELSGVMVDFTQIQKIDTSSAGTNSEMGVPEALVSRTGIRSKGGTIRVMEKFSWHYQYFWVN
jgi:hypothetical protein